MPIRVIDEKNKTDKTLHEEIVKNVEVLTRLYPEILLCKLQNKTEQLQSRADFHISKIDELVYQLYDLTPEEIKIVKESVS